MKLSKIGARYANTKRKDSTDKPLEWHLAHLHSEVSEVFASLRELQALNGGSTNGPMAGFSTVLYGKDGHPEGFGIELADVVMVAAFIAETTGVDLEKMIEQKLAWSEGSKAR